MSTTTKGASYSLAIGAAVAAVMVGSIACGGGDGGRSAEGPQPEPTPGPQPEATPPATAVPGAPDPQQVKATIVRVADWQLANPVKRDPRHWSMAALYDGLIDASIATGDPKYLAAVIRTGRRVEYRLGSRLRHADGHAAGHAWLRIYLMNPVKDPRVLQPFVEQFDEIVDKPLTDDLTFLKPPPPGEHVTDRYTWADALYMSPPTVALLASATGDQKYLRWLDSEYKFAYDALYDKGAHLWYRDATYIDQRSPSGKKIFWSRGNGWVYAGLALMLDFMPADYPTRPFYVGLLQEMSPALLAAQQPDGFWYPNLADPEQVKIGETSGTALFLIGMTAGIRTGHLDPATYWPAVDKGWSAILTRIDPDGKVTAAQPFGERPEVFDLKAAVTFATGAVLTAGRQIIQTQGAAEGFTDLGKMYEDAAALVEQAPDLTTICDRCVDPVNPPAPPEAELRSQR